MNDEQLIFEKYNELHEGLFDRAKANVAGAVGAVKELGNRVGGAVKGAVAGATGNVQGAQAAAAQGQQGANAGTLAKIQSYRNTAHVKFKKLADETFADLQKLGIDLKKVSPNTINTFTSALSKSFDALIQNITNPPQPAQQAQQQPAKPAAKPVAKVNATPVTAAPQTQQAVPKATRTP